jgi:hypothetical protein
MMKRLVPLILSSLFCMNAAAQKVAVSVKFGYIQPYCGGARPTKEMQEDAQKVKPYAGKTIIAISGNRVDSCRTNKSGIWTKKLLPGEYAFYEAWQYYQRGIGGKPVKSFLLDCLQSQWKKEVFKLTVKTREPKTHKAPEIRLRCEFQLPCLIEQPPLPE